MILGARGNVKGPLNPLFFALDPQNDSNSLEKFSNMFDKSSRKAKPQTSNISATSKPIFQQIPGGWFNRILNILNIGSTFMKI